MYSIQLCLFVLTVVIHNHSHLCAIEEMLIILAGADLSILGNNRSVNRKWPKWLMANWSSIPFSDKVFEHIAIPEKRRYYLFIQNNSIFIKHKQVYFCHIKKCIYSCIYKILNETVERQEHFKTFKPTFLPLNLFNRLLSSI